jgi:hypothetical protein
LSAAHPSIWKLIETIKEEQSLTEMKMAQIIAGGNPSEPRRKKYRELEDRLLNVVSNYGNDPISDYLTGIAQNISFQV